MNDNAQIVTPAKNVAGTLRLPGDKSLSHRYAMLGALAEGNTRLQNFAAAADCASTLACLEQLGCRVQRDGVHVTVEGRAMRLAAPDAALDCGNSGSTMRMLAGILAGHPFTAELRGDDSLSRRPMARIAAPLRQMGAEIVTADGDRPPLRIRGGRLRSIDYSVPIASAQVKSAILFAGLYAEGQTCVTEPVRTRDHTELALRAFGATLTRSRQRVCLVPGQPLRAIETTVAGDLSSAAFFLCAAALFPGSNLLVEDVLLNPTRAALLDVLVAMGARISILKVEDRHGELVGSLHMQGGPLKGVTVAGERTAALIDEIPVLAAIAPFTKDGMTLNDAAELRVKESDRLAAVASNLRAMGAKVEEYHDGLRIPGGQVLRGGEVDSLGDHRIAMAFAIAALRAQGETRIRNADCAAVSFPGFFDVLETVLER